MNKLKIPNVTVIITSFNRANLLKKTIPGYLANKSVIELIFVDDGSSDDTFDIISQLSCRFPNINYIRLALNCKQPFANNIGINAAKGEYIYFGDDDSFLLPNSIDALLDSLLEYNADIAGARALYLKDGDLDNLDNFVKSKDKQNGELCNLSKLKFNFALNTLQITEVTACHACFLTTTTLAKRIMFDTGYKGNAFREDTDFVIRAKYQGAKIIFNPFVIQFNLPRSIAKNGAHSMNIFEYRLNCFNNNWYFLKKNEYILKSLNGSDKTNIYSLQLRYLIESVYHLIAHFTPLTIKLIIKKYI